MTSKFERARLADLRKQLRDDLELYLMLQQAQDGDVEALPELIRIAHAALQESARAYREAGGALIAPPPEPPPTTASFALRTARLKARAEPSGEEMRTEDLMKLFDDDEPK
ncbi:MAG: hypothetical protein IRZ16_04495 [Myxococcaceae bacterium]|nr:hypothetical protein [Myxococcaceae bacterium]